MFAWGKTMHAWASTYVWLLLLQRLHLNLLHLVMVLVVWRLHLLLLLLLLLLLHHHLLYLLGHLLVWLHTLHASRLYHSTWWSCILIEITHWSLLLLHLLHRGLLLAIDGLALCSPVENRSWQLREGEHQLLCVFIWLHLIFLLICSVTLYKKNMDDVL